MNPEDISAAIILFRMEKEKWNQPFPEFFYIKSQGVLVHSTIDRTFNIYRSINNKYEKVFDDNIPFVHMWGFEDKTECSGLVILLANRKKWVVIQKDSYLIDFTNIWTNLNEINVMAVGRTGSREIRIGDMHKHLTIFKKSKTVKLIKGSSEVIIESKVLAPLSKGFSL